MTLFARGLFWLSLYLLLVLAPAAVAVLVNPFVVPRPFLLEVSVGLGLIATPMILAQFALVSRIKTAARPFGTDALVQLHRYMGSLAVLFVISHVILLNLRGLPWSAWSPIAADPTARSGAIALWSLVLLLATTLLRERLRISYEWWRTLHVVLAVLATGTLAAHIAGVGNYSGTAAMRTMLGAYLVAGAAILLQYRVVRPVLLHRRPWRVEANVDEGASTRTLRVRPVGHYGFPFDPGQFAWLVTGRSPFSRQQHPITIASSAERGDTGEIELSIKALGDWSTDTVPDIAPGTTVWIDGPFGAFTTERKAAQGFVFIAGGIGITPIRSMLLTMRDRGDRRHAVLLYATHDRSRTPFRKELESAGDKLNLDIIEVLEEPPDDWTGETGFIDDGILDRHLPPHFRRYHFFTCGPARMMNSVEAMLRSRGVPPGAIHSERFDMV